MLARFAYVDQHGAYVKPPHAKVINDIINQMSDVTNTQPLIN
jgi:hypothetical protein